MRVLLLMDIITHVCFNFVFFGGLFRHFRMLFSS